MEVILYLGDAGYTPTKLNRCSTNIIVPCCQMKLKTDVNTKVAEMKSTKKIDIFNKSALVSLKAELSKKQEEARQAKHKAKGETVIPTRVPQKLNEYSKSNRGIEDRNKKDAEQIQAEEAAHKDSRNALEEKAKLYDKLVQGQEVIDSESEGRFLVNFEQKALEESKKSPEVITLDEEDEEECLDSDDYDNPSDPEDDWVDYRDCLGRTRRCLRRDLPFIKSKDTKLADLLGMGESNPVPEQEKNKSVSEEPEKEDEMPVNKNLELVSEDMHREEMRKKWEEQEDQLRQKDDVHYQDVLFDEVRTHGVAYYAFSREEKARKAEQEELQKLRDETVKGQAAASDLRTRRKEQMAARLKAARARKRAREGLPPEETGQDEESATADAPGEGAEDETLTMWPDCKAVEIAKAEEEEMERRRAKIDEAEERRKKRVPSVRPWDIGKEGVVTGKADPMTQEEWVKKKREERPSEFAPPPEFARTEQDSVSTDDYISYNSGWNASHLRATTKKALPRRDNVAGPSGMGGSQKKKPFRKEIPSSSSSFFIDTNPNVDSEMESEGLKTRKRAEIPPPATFEYYGPSSSKQKFQQGKGDQQNQASLDDAISAGLQYLRQQAEDREKQKEKGLLDII